MDVEPRDIELMLELQGVDIEIMKTKRLREELPQRNRMAAVKRKKSEFESKREQVDALLQKAEGELEDVEAEDASLSDKQKRAQDLIDAAGSDFRSVESHSKEMGGFAKRREALAQKSDELSTHISNARGVLERIDGGLEVLEKEAAAIRASFAEDDGKLADELAGLEERRNQIVDQMDKGAYAVYSKTAARTGGVAIGRLNENTCGVCRSVIEGGRLIELHASAPLGVCPSCKRLLVVE